MGPASSDADEMFLSVFFFRATVGKGNLKKDQASLTAKCPTENALRAGMPDCESRSLLNRRATQPEKIFFWKKVETKKMIKNELFSKHEFLSKRAALQELP